MQVAIQTQTDRWVFESVEFIEIFDRNTIKMQADEDCGGILITEVEENV